MSRPDLTTLRRRASIAALALALGGMPALAQGTKEQREACTADAINLCQDTIPDVEKTTACMKKHVAELSPKCRAEVVGIEGNPATPPDSHAAEAPRPNAEDDQTGSLQSLPPDDPDVADDSLGDYRRSIAKSCRAGLIDPFTCRNTMRALNAGQ